MSIANQRFNLSPDQFYDLPFFVFIQMFKMTESEESKKSNRKYIVDGMRSANKKFGWI